MEEMNLNQNQNADPVPGQVTREKTFTQEDVNRIIQERLAKEKAKSNGEADLAKRGQELAQRELRLSARESLTGKGLPTELLDALNCTDKETMEKSIATVEKIFNGYRASAIKQIKFRGFQPGASGDIKLGAAGDLEIRKAMGLRT